MESGFTLAFMGHIRLSYPVTWDFNSDQHNLSKYIRISELLSDYHQHQQSLFLYNSTLLSVTLLPSHRSIDLQKYLIFAIQSGEKRRKWFKRFYSDVFKFCFLWFSARIHVSCIKNCAAAHTAAPSAAIII